LKYQVHLEVFEGPLDLLIKQLTNEEIPVGKISVCKIIDQFVDYYMGFAFSDLEEGGRFFVLAATLLAVKGRFLLPRREEEEDEDDSDPLLEEEEQLETDFGEYLAFQENLNHVKMRPLKRLTSDSQVYQIWHIPEPDNRSPGNLSCSLLSS
jgi:segregation and condensation protein A